VANSGRFIPQNPSRKIWEDNENQWSARCQGHGVGLWSRWNREGKILHLKSLAYSQQLNVCRRGLNVLICLDIQKWRTMAHKRDTAEWKILPWGRKERCFPGCWWLAYNV